MALKEMMALVVVHLVVTHKRKSPFSKEKGDFFQFLGKAAGAAWVVAGVTSSAEAIVVPVKTVPKTTEAKVRVCLRKIVYFFKIRPLFNKLFSLIPVFKNLSTIY
ncbi:hypothetical protein LPB406_03580 [Streptococcus sp. LPB0406]|nr:hypothetical protein [Streptococcus sp. LPB0406]